MKKTLKILFLGILGIFLVVANSNADLFDDQWEEYTGDPLGEISVAAALAVGPGYFIWANDDVRRNWSVRWAGAGTSDDYYFSGAIALSDNTFDVTSILFEAHSSTRDTATVFGPGGTPVTEIGPGVETTVFGALELTYAGLANTHWDGFDLEIMGDIIPAYIGFDLFINGPGDLGLAKDRIWIGEIGSHPESQDFKIAAPVPEPATMLLLGTGLVGLAAFGRRKFKKQA